MENKKIIEILKKDIKELKKEGIKKENMFFSDCFNEVSLMIRYSEGTGLGCTGAYSYRIIKFKTKIGLDNFYNSIKDLIGEVY